MQNTIVGPNTGGSCGGSINGVSRNVTSHNLDADGTCLFASTDEGTTGNPRLAGLANNGGPTDTMALGAGSPAINAGDPQICPAGSGTDQRYATAVGRATSARSSSAASRRSPPCRRRSPARP